jgi:fructosamine-3-kinase
MLKLCKKNGFEVAREVELREKVKTILDKHVCEASLVHGDLWSGNQAFTTNSIPVIFDPAVYVFFLFFSVFFYIL